MRWRLHVARLTQIEALRKRPATIAVLGAELGAGRELSSAIQSGLEARRERFGLRLFKLAHDAPAGLDVPALASVATAAIHYLLIRARTVAHFNGVPLGRDEGWQRTQAAIAAAIAGATSTSA